MTNSELMMQGCFGPVVWSAAATVVHAGMTVTVGSVLQSFSYVYPLLLPCQPAAAQKATWSSSRHEFSDHQPHTELVDLHFSR